jgi:hypothetical protein
MRPVKSTVFLLTCPIVPTPRSPLEENVRAAMKREGIASVADLGRRAHVGRTHLYQVFREPDATSLDTLRRLARALHEPLTNLVGEGVVEHPYPPEWRRLFGVLAALTPEDRNHLGELLTAVLAAVQYGSEHNSRNPDARNDGSLTQRNVSSSIHPTLPTEDTPRRRTVHIEAPNVREPGAITKKPKQQRGLDQGDDPVRR